MTSHKLTREQRNEIACTVALPHKLLVARAVMELGLPARRWCREAEAA